MATTRTRPLCELRGVQKCVRPGHRATPLRVLEDIDLAIRPNEVVASSGRPGCGKSTILRIFAGLIAPTEGEVLYHGAPLAGLNPGVAHRVPELRALPVDDGRRERRGGAAGAGAAARRGCTARARQCDPPRRPRRLRGRLPARALRRHEAAGRHGARALGRPRDALHGRAVQPGRRADGREPARRGARHLGDADKQPVVDPDGEPRHQGSRLHGGPDRRAARQPGPDSHASSRTACRGRATIARRSSCASSTSSTT